ncbi:hypothetical protein Gotri_003619 [Gossypium trilobum]|uniref:Uncharacterized protein n=1 Tax=Gossypium trilobum TaxID=34281 RepID=A0A7J9F228_9ROSI|nr:hypothetical protein [Gossypium trilobum]
MREADDPLRWIQIKGFGLLVDDHPPKKITEPIETREKTRKASRSRDMLLGLEERVVNLKDSLGDVKKTLEEVERRIVELDLKKSNSRKWCWSLLVPI